MNTKDLVAKLLLAQTDQTAYCPISGKLCYSVKFANSQPCTREKCRVYHRAQLLAQPKPEPSPVGPVGIVYYSEDFEIRAIEEESPALSLIRNTSGRAGFMSTEAREVFLAHFHNDEDLAY